MQAKKLSVSILYYVGLTDDDKDTILSVKGIEESLMRTGHRVRKKIVTGKNWRQALSVPGDIVFNLVEDDNWELYEKVAYGLETVRRAQVGHDLSDLPFAIQKIPAKKLMGSMHISTPAFSVYTPHTKSTYARGLQFPIIIKPANQHAGIGISQQSVVLNAEEFSHAVTKTMKQYRGNVIAEEFIAGREIHVTIMGNGSQLTTLPFCEILFKGTFKQHWNVYTYDAKWEKKTWEYADARVKAPAKVSAEVHKKIMSLATRAFHAFNCRDIARFDMRVNKKGKPYIVDVNMNPSINFYDDQDATLASVYAHGWIYDEFIERLLTITANRCAR